MEEIVDSLDWEKKPGLFEYEGKNLSLHQFIKKFFSVASYKTNIATTDFSPFASHLYHTFSFFTLLVLSQKCEFTAMLGNLRIVLFRVERDKQKKIRQKCRKFNQKYWCGQSTSPLARLATRPFAINKSAKL